MEWKSGLTLRLSNVNQSKFRDSTNSHTLNQSILGETGGRADD